MTVKTPKNRNNYIGTGLLSDYAWEFRMVLASWFEVKIRNLTTGAVETLVESAVAGFTILNGLGDTSGGTIQLRAASAPRLLLATESLSIRRVVPVQQDVDIRNQGDSFPDRVEDALDFTAYIAQNQQDDINASAKLDSSIDPATVDMRLPIPKALQFWRWDAAATGIEGADIASLGAVGLPAGNGIAIYVGANNFINRILSKTGDITIDNGDGVSANPTVNSTVIDAKIAANTVNITTNTANIAVANSFVASEQGTPDNTVKLSSAIVFDPVGTGPSVVVAAGAADAITFPSVSADSRIDVLSANVVTGVVTKTAGVEDASPVAPAYPFGEIPICEVTVNETGAVTILDADIRDIRSTLNSISGGLNRDVAELSFTRDMDTTGNLVIAHGLDGIPSIIFGSMINNGAGKGGNGNGICFKKKGSNTFAQQHTSKNDSGTGQSGGSGNSLLGFHKIEGTDFVTGTVTAVDGTNITIAFAQTGASTDTISYKLSLQI